MHSTNQIIIIRLSLVQSTWSNQPHWIQLQLVLHTRCQGAPFSTGHILWYIHVRLKPNQMFIGWPVHLHTYIIYAHCSAFALLETQIIFITRRSIKNENTRCCFFREQINIHILSFLGKKIFVHKNNSCVPLIFMIYLFLMYIKKWYIVLKIMIKWRI
jgi:hypothetical protein